MPPAVPLNLIFLAHHDPRCVVLGMQAERHFAEDPNTCLAKRRRLGELLSQRAAARLGLDTSPENSQSTLINRLCERGAPGATIRQLFHELHGA